MTRCWQQAVLAMLILGMHTPAVATGTYQEPAAFINEVFAGRAPKPERLQLRGEVAARVGAILGHAYGAARLRYWREADRTAWILDEIGKEQPITVGIVVTAGSIERVKVLVFREGRGHEVRHPFFTDQFSGARLDANDRLDRSIDGISGATLSVNALRRLARVALLLDAHVRSSSP